MQSVPVTVRGTQREHGGGMSPVGPALVKPAASQVRPVKK